MPEERISVIVLTAFLTYSLPKIIELLMKRFGEPRINLDTANIQNALKLYDALSEKYSALETKNNDLEAKLEKSRDEVDALEKRNEELERKYWLLERTAERVKVLEKENIQLRERLAIYETEQ